MLIHLHKTNHIDSQVLQVVHGLAPQVAVAGAGRGQYTIWGGHPQIHPLVLEILKLNIVWRVICADGYFLISVSEPRRWGEIEGQLHHIVAKALKA